MRRGSTTYVVVGFALFLAVLLVCVVVILAIRDVYNKTEEDARCASQIRTHAAMVKVTSDLKAPNVVCPTRVVSVPVGIDGKKVLADEMKSCWDTWGRGKLQLFGEQRGAYCHVCTMAYLDEPIEEFPAYLDSAKVDDVTYAQYFAGTTSGEYFTGAEHPDLASPTLLPEDPIAVIFYYEKQQDVSDRVWNFLVGDPTTGHYKGGGVALFVAWAGPFGWVSGGALVLAGAITGEALSLAAREDLDYLSAVLVRPLQPEDVAHLGCTYAPVANA